MVESDILLGYYICKQEKCPDFLNITADTFISVSDCLCVHEPQIIRTHGWKPNGDKKEYIDSLSMNMDQYIKMSSEINDLFNENLFFGDGRFLNYKDAKYFYGTYFSGLSYSLIAVTMDEKYLDLLGEDFSLDKDEGLKEETKYIGCDIIGWDFSGFHSFLCNSLHMDYTYLQFNKYGLVNDTYSTVEEITAEIQGQGEPVDWVPVKIYMC